MRMVRGLRRGRRKGAAVIALLGAGVASLLGVGIAAAVGVPMPIGPASFRSDAAANPLSVLSYSIRTRYTASATGPCTLERTVPAVLGVPALVDVGGSFLPDVLVTVIGVPGVRNSPDVLQVSVAKLALGTLRASVEAVIAPSSSEPGRIAAGPDGCETGLPTTFSATATSSDAALRVLATTIGPTKALAVLGSSYDAVGATNTNLTAVRARMTPVPSRVVANIEINGSQNYRAKVTTNSKTDLNLVYRTEKAAESTAVTADVATFPGELDLTYTERTISYTASAAMQKVDLTVESAAPGKWTSRLTANLTGVPTQANLERPTPSKFVFSTPTLPGVPKTSIGTADVTFAQFDPDPQLALGKNLPTLAPAGPQYLVTRLEPSFTVARARLLGLSEAEIDSADPVTVDVAHTAGPFRVVADLIGPATRHLEVDVRNLPAIATVTYSPATLAFSYVGSAIVDTLAATVTSSEPFVEGTNAKRSNLSIVSLPPGLNGRFDAAAETFTATMTGGAIGSLEAGVTSGVQKTLPADQQGVLVEDRPGGYDAFVRILGLEKATVGWGTTQLADVVHQAGSFKLQVDTPTLDIDGLIQDLPRRAFVSYGPATVPTDPGLPVISTQSVLDTLLPTLDDPNSPGDLPDGDPVLDPGTDPPGDGPDVETGPPVTAFVYRGSAPIGSIDFDVVGTTPLFGRATEAHLLASSLPKGVTVTLFRDTKHLDVRTSDRDEFNPEPSPLGYLEIETCSPGACDLPPTPGTISLPGRDGLWVTDNATRYHVKSRLVGLSKLGLDWAPDKIGVDLVHPKRPFDVMLEQRHSKALPKEPTAYTTVTTVRIGDLPAQATLTFDPVSQRLVYTGSTTIASIVADHSTTGRPLAGRAKYAHLDIDDFPRSVDLTFAFDDLNQKLIATAADPSTPGGKARIGHLALDLLSDRSLLAKESVASNLILDTPTRVGRDGLMLWDLKDNVAEVHPVLDPYILLVRATNVERVSYLNRASGDDSKRFRDLTVDLERSTATDLYVEIRRTVGPPSADQSFKPEVPLDGFPNALYRLEGVYGFYSGAPATLGFAITTAAHRVGPNEIDDLLYLKAYGSSVGRELRVDTNIGKIVDLTTRIGDVPVGTAANPGLQACVSGNSLNCLRNPYNKELGDETPFSFDLVVATPITVRARIVAPSDDTNMTIDVNYVKSEILDDPTKVPPVDPAHIARKLTVGAQSDSSVSNSTVVFLDTDYEPVDAKVDVYDGSDLDLNVRAPEGFRAKDRFVEIERFGVNEGRNRGFALCPRGFSANSFFVGRFNLNDDLCTQASMVTISSNTVVADGQPHTFNVTGVGFAAPAGGEEGAHLCFRVLLGDDCDRSFTSVQWVNPFFLRATVTVPIGTPPGERRLFVQNPTDARFSQDSPLACDCKLTITPP